MGNSEIIVGLDIGTTKVCAIVGRKNEFGKIDVLGMGRADCFGVSHGVVINIEKTVDAIKKAVAEASAKSNVDINTVHVGIAGQHINSLQQRSIITRPNSEESITLTDLRRMEDEMYQIAVQPGTEIIHVLPQEYTVDNVHGVKDPIGMLGTRLECNYHLITGHVSAVKNICLCVKKAGLDIDDIILEPLASSEAVLSAEELEAGVALVDIGGGTTDLAVFYDGIIRHTAVIPLAGNIITNDIKVGCGLLTDVAERLKKECGCALADEARENEVISITAMKGRSQKEISMKNLARIIQARVEEIFEHVYYEIKSSGYDKKLAAGIVITGGGSQLRYLSQLVELVTGLDARIGYPTEHLAKGFVEEVKSPVYATGVGLLIRGLKETELKGSLEKNQRSAQSPVSFSEPAATTTSKTQPESSPAGFFSKILQKGKDFLNDEDDTKDFTR